MAHDHDSKMEDELFNSLKEGDIGMADRAYNCFKAIYRQSRCGVFFVVREKSGMRYRVVKRVAKKDLGENILSDETIQLTGQRTSKEYPDAMAILRSYGIAPPPDSGGAASGMPYLPGFEKMFLKSVG